MSTKGIIHLDMDAFYASVEVLDNSALKGRPIIVGGLGSRGVVSTASYEARACGVHSALPMITARRLCPAGVFISPRFERYQELSGRIMAIFLRYTPLVEPLALDEAFLDVSASFRLFGPAAEIARRLKEEVRTETGLTVSAGVATQKQLAKIASGLNKPDGLTIVPPGKELDFLWSLPLSNLWGVGKVMLKRLRNLGLTIIGDLAALDLRFLEKKFGRSGEQLWLLANGRDDRGVSSDRKSKSVGAEETFAVDLVSPVEIKAALLAQSLTAVERLRRKGFKAQNVTVKFRDGCFKTIIRTKVLAVPTDIRDEIYFIVLNIYEKIAPELGAMRLVGVILSRLSGKSEIRPGQLFLFDQLAMASERKTKDFRATQLNQALDQVVRRFGAGTIKPATLIKS
ncbi:MAG: DNA polymerase IV [Candidatus Adiutrix intracellularis]|jgi:DNA polymerase-4|nr:DNA polymerase IV [Candidatus Adiutrix intracellularis]